MEVHTPRQAIVAGGTYYEVLGLGKKKREIFFFFFFQNKRKKKSILI